ncbi:hypothetical protein J7I98_23495 [Streptomyces sp. ISL-98]|uniref:hypothetical protein n=1 Tax=Streptomyces sp. ISL-98 TaxID=2819192 RepID=UPI001BE85E29|nr:hypothetical protein [Streptomyces sp. ISL-98]MBT2508795.1 hypothetical protein [Streptomyces sp. ISL-98]
MADTPYPHYRLQADGPNETGLTLLIQVTVGAGGPLPGLTEQSVVEELRDSLDARIGVMTQLSKNVIAATNLEA